MIFKTSIDKLSRGCGKETHPNSYSTCGEDNPKYGKYCKSCQAQLSLAKELGKKIEDALNLCKVCGGTHGDWIKKDELKKNLEKI